MTLVFLVSLISVTITDIKALNGSEKQRQAAGFNILLDTPSNVLPPMRNDIEGPAHQMFTTIFWGILIGEASNLWRRKKARRQRHASTGFLTRGGFGIRWRRDVGIDR
jgi:hypothetical protein